MNDLSKNRNNSYLARVKNHLSMIFLESRAQTDCIRRRKRIRFHWYTVDPTPSSNLLEISDKTFDNNKRQKAFRYWHEPSARHIVTNHTVTKIYIFWSGILDLSIEIIELVKERETHILQRKTTTNKERRKKKKLPKTNLSRRHKPTHKINC